VVLVVLVLMAAVAWFSYVQAKKRQELFHQFALGQGWTWVARDDSWADRFAGQPFGTGDHRRADNVLQGSFGARTMVAFDYSFQTHTDNGKGGRSTTTHRYAVCALALPAWVPKLELVPEGLLGRIGTALGMQDVELESEDFNRRYRVRCDQPKFAYDVLPPRTMEALLGQPALHLRLADTEALCWEDGTHSPAVLLARLSALSSVLDGIPAFVWTDLKGHTP
jgi:hypothetical protein